MSGYHPDKCFPYGLAIGEKYGEGTTLFLYRLANPLHEKNAIPKQEGWTEIELGSLKDAAKRGARVYEQTYFMLRPRHQIPLHKAA